MIKIDSHMTKKVQKPSSLHVTKALRRTTKKQTGRASKWLKRYGFIAVNALILVVVAGVLMQSRAQTEPTVQIDRSTSENEGPVVLDEISSADIAVNIAIAARLPEVDSVRNQADSRSALVAIATPDEVVISKPQIVSSGESGTQSRQDIIRYVVQQGDTVQALAERYGVDENSIRWSNGITGNSFTTGREIVIPPANRSGIVYKVGSSDSIDKLAERYSSSADKIIAFNDLELTQTLPVGEYIFIPDGEKPPEPVRSNVRSTYTTNTASYRPIYGGNGYSFGWCTYGAALRRAQLGNPIPTNWGNANTWDDYARAAGYLVDHNPSVGAVFQTDGYGHTIYHVGIVEEIYPDGSIRLFEYNYYGWNVASWNRIIPASEVPKYNYIH